MRIVGTKNGRPLSPREVQGLRLLGDQLRRARLGNGWSQRRLERMSGVDQTTISRLENGKLPSLRLARIVDLMQALSGTWSIFDSADDMRASVAALDDSGRDPPRPVPSRLMPRTASPDRTPGRALGERPHHTRDANDGIAKEQEKFGLYARRRATGATRRWRSPLP